MWHKLAWVDPFWMDSDARVKGLLAQGRGFSEEDKLVLREVELEILGRVVPEYAAASARGQIEIAASPFYHPILPLVCDTDIYLRTHPHSRMPRQRFRHPEDALAQLERAAVYHEQRFGRRPVGLWPSEGSVSDAIVPLATQAGFTWIATDEAILARTLNTGLTRDGYGHLEQPEVLYRPYTIRTGGGEVACLFRDHVLSDLIGFTYASWNPAAAAADFVARLVEAGRRFSARTGGAEAVVPIILDGENAWEHYEGQGRPFLRALYGALSAHPELKTVTMSEAVQAPSSPLSGIFPGSWINADFYVWIGHADDHRAWGQLADARQALEAPGPSATREGIVRAREELYIAEGSDWFWWYGDDHSSDHDLEFDDLFRRHLRNVYKSLDKPVPEELFLTNITTEPPRMTAHPPSGFLTPTLDGEVTSYFEWVGAGQLELESSGGSMHRVAPTRQSVVTGLQFGFDATQLYFRVDFSSPGPGRAGRQGRGRADLPDAAGPAGPGAGRRSRDGRQVRAATIPGCLDPDARGRRIGRGGSDPGSVAGLGGAGRGRRRTPDMLHRRAAGRARARAPSSPPAAGTDGARRRLQRPPLVRLSTTFAAPRVPTPELRRPIGHPVEIKPRKPSTGACSSGFVDESDNIYYVYQHGCDG